MLESRPRTNWTGRGAETDDPCFSGTARIPRHRRLLNPGYAKLPSVLRRRCNSQRAKLVGPCHRCCHARSSATVSVARMCVARPTSLSPPGGRGRNEGVWRWRRKGERLGQPALPTSSSLNLFNRRTRPPLSDTLCNDCAAALLPSVPPVLTSPLLLTSHHHQQLRRDTFSRRMLP